MVWQSAGQLVNVDNQTDSVNTYVKVDYAIQENISCLWK